MFTQLSRTMCKFPFEYDIAIFTTLSRWCVLLLGGKEPRDGVLSTSPDNGR